jgi:hypothetical protein
MATTLTQADVTASRGAGGGETHIEGEGRRLIDQAWEAGISARLLGGLAVAERVPGEIRAMFARPLGDIDLVIARRESGRLVTFMEQRGYREHVEYNAMNGRTRLMFVDSERGREVDVFVEEFRMCHAVPLRLEEADRRGSRVLPLADLLLTKLQIVELTEKDTIDILMLVIAYAVAGDEEDAIDADWIAARCGEDWGLWRTVSGNIRRVASAVDRFGLPPARRADALIGLRVLSASIEQCPKSRKWRVRARVGERVRWYEEPDEK